MSKIDLEDVKKVFPEKKFLVLAVENLDLDATPEESIGKKSHVFSASTFSDRSDFIQAAVMLATDKELREAFKLVLDLTENMLSNPEIQEHLKDVISSSK